jgi:hypothetical protein
MSRPPLTSVWQLPDVRAVYALYGGSADERRLVFVGFAESLLERVVEQLVVPNLRPRAPSATLFMQPGYVREIRWWEHALFEDPDALRAAEFVASERLLPLLSSRRPSSAGARTLSTDEGFREQMTALILGEPSGRLFLPTLEDILHRLGRIEERLGGAASRPPRAAPSSQANPLDADA